MDKKEPKYCWEYRNCEDGIRKKCPAYLYSEEDCWMLASHPSGEGCPWAKGKGILYCASECEWYKKKKSALTRESKL
ncbi:MAG: hypothetical protein HQL21_04790 [Candidatus Omnitrophica bacterium]|nr:hypothetical protein [Candidatus Omnitrophota bacterium]